MRKKIKAQLQKENVAYQEKQSEVLPSPKKRIIPPSPDQWATHFCLGYPIHHLHK